MIIVDPASPSPSDVIRPPSVTRPPQAQPPLTPTRPPQAQPPRPHDGGSRSRWGWVLVFLVAGCIILFYVFSSGSTPSPEATATTRVQATAIAIAGKTATAEAQQSGESQNDSVNVSQTATAVAKTTTAEAKVAATAEARTAATARAKTAIARESSADQTSIENIVRRYGEEIKVENTTYLNSSSLSQVLVDPVLERQKRSTCWLENEGLYYTYSNRRFTIDSVTFDGDRQATVLARIRENRVLRNQDGSVYKDYGYEDYRAIYQLKKMSNAKWYIYCFQTLEDGEAAQCMVKLEGDDPCR